MPCHADLLVNPNANFPHYFHISPAFFSISCRDGNGVDKLEFCIGILIEFLGSMDLMKWSDAENLFPARIDDGLM